MSVKKKYSLLILTVLILFLYIIATEIPDRFSKLTQNYMDYSQKKETVLNPEKLQEKKLSLLQMKQSLTSVLTKDGRKYEQNQTGVIEYLNDCAREAGIKYESLIPTENQSAGQIKEIGFKLTMLSRYNKVGKFLNTVENGALMICIKKLEINGKEGGLTPLYVIIQGVAYIFPGK
jgi:Tfp pilus assembly protein PilO